MRFPPHTSLGAQRLQQTTLVIEQPSHLPCERVLSVILSRFNYTISYLTKYEQRGRTLIEV